MVQGEVLQFDGIVDGATTLLDRNRTVGVLFFVLLVHYKAHRGHSFRGLGHLDLQRHARPRQRKVEDGHTRHPKKWFLEKVNACRVDGLVLCVQ